MKKFVQSFTIVTILVSSHLGYSKNKGLSNCGNSCYFNASLQCLSHLDKFNEQLEDGLYKPDDLLPRFYVALMSKIKGEGVLNCNFEILDNYTENNFYHLVGTDFFITNQKKTEDYDTYGKKAGDPKVDGEWYFSEYSKNKNSFIKKYIIDQSDQRVFEIYRTYFIGQQEDAPEFIDKIREKLLNPLGKEKQDYLLNLILPKFMSELIRSCGHQSLTPSPNEPLSVPIPDQSQVHPLVDCIIKFSETEELKGDNSVYCEKCKKKVDATKSLKMDKMPLYFMIVLKRYSSDLYGSTKKLSTPISFPKILEITKNSNFLSSNFISKIGETTIKYNLIAFVVQSGSTGGGHYWAYGKDKNDTKTWWKYDDSSVTDVTNSIDNILSSGRSGSGTPYILFYELDVASETELEKLGLIKSPTQPKQPQLQQQLTQLKITLQTLKTKLDALRGKLEDLKQKFGK